MSRVFVGGFPRDLEEEELKEIFQAFGQVEAVKIVRDKRTGISRRFGFVDMDSKENADLAIVNLHEGSIDEDIISVKHAVIEEPKPKVVEQPRERAQKVQWGQRPQFKGKQNNGYGKSNNGGGYNKSNNGYNKSGGGYGNQNRGYGNQNNGYGNQGNSYNNNRGNSYGNQGNSYGNQSGGYNNQGGGYNSQGSGYGNQGGYRPRPQNDSGAGEGTGNSNKPKRPRINRNG